MTSHRRQRRRRQRRQRCQRRRHCRCRLSRLPLETVVMTKTWPTGGKEDLSQNYFRAFETGKSTAGKKLKSKKLYRAN